MSWWRKFLIRHLAARWELVWIENQLEGLLAGEPLRWHPVINPYSDCWFADPFILESDPSTVRLLAEAYSIHACRGSIALITIDRRTKTITDREWVLKDDSHYSFPFIIGQQKDSIDFMPENHDRGSLSVYRYDRVQKQAAQLCLVAREPLTDAVIWDGRLYATHEADRVWDRLGVYEPQDGLYEKTAEIGFRENYARNAGAFFECHGKVYHPAQVCSRMYGEALSLQEVITGNRGTVMREVSRYSIGAGMHSLTTKDGVIISDRKLFPHPWLSKLAYRLTGKSDR